MDESRPSRWLSLGWALFLFWPLAFTPLLLVPYLLHELNSSLVILCAPVVFVMALVVLTDVVLRLFKTRRTDCEPVYPCPTCGADIEHTPHCCRNCGARLIWGHEPGPRDVRSFSPRFVEH